jgi:lysophospholipase L1-like esterase
MWRPIILTAAAAVGLAGLLPAPAAQAATVVTYRIAVLGDSWAAGEGNGSYIGGTGKDVTGCHRSANAWIYRVVLPGGNTVRQEMDKGFASLQFLACQGGTTYNVLTDTQGDPAEAPQLSRMASNVTTIFLSVSGNDLKFGDILGACANTSAADCKKTADAARSGAFPTAVSRLKTTIKKIHAAAPTAEIVLTGYAPVVSEGSKFFKESWSVLHDLALDYVAAEKAAVGVLDDTINVKFANIAPDFAGHADGAPNQASWFFGFEVDLRTSTKWATRTVHPNEKGEVAIAKVASTKVLTPFSCPATVSKESHAPVECVKTIQRALNAWTAAAKELTFAPLTVDGDFGAKTEAAVKAFRHYEGLSKSGVVDSMTKAFLFTK